MTPIIYCHHEGDGIESEASEPCHGQQLPMTIAIGGSMLCLLYTPMLKLDIVTWEHSNGR